jgi:hypothetical protein
LRSTCRVESSYVRARKAIEISINLTVSHRLRVLLGGILLEATYVYYRWQVHFAVRSENSERNSQFTQVSFIIARELSRKKETTGANRGPIVRQREFPSLILTFEGLGILFRRRFFLGCDNVQMMDFEMLVARS